tara:strand:+ start:996 stop:1505 length:510 start_codon:yes stop_codon:yes gene_type:complete
MFVKKLLLLFILFYLTSCSSIRDQSNETVIIDCPRVFFSSENNIYVSGNQDDIELNEVNFKSSLNNYGFVQDCLNDGINNQYNLDLLIITEPINPKFSNITLPIFLLLYDKENNLIDKQYFKVEGNLNINNETNEYVVTDIVKNLKILSNTKSVVDSITIGFVKLVDNN